MTCYSIAWHRRHDRLVGGINVKVLYVSNGSVASTGPIDFRHAFLDMTKVDVKEGTYTRAGRTCPAAMGFSFAAGTTDGTNPTLLLCNSFIHQSMGCLFEQYSLLFLIVEEMMNLRQLNELGM